MPPRACGMFSAQTRTVTREAKQLPHRMILHHATIDDTDYTFSWPRTSTLLDAMLAAGIPAPYSCTLGECGACQCTVEGGKSHMRANAVLDDGDISDDQRLACQTIRDEDVPYDVSYLW